MSTYQLSIVTPSGKIFEGEVSSLMAPGTTGSFGVLAKHAPTVTGLKKGIIKIIKDNNEKYFTISNGFFEMNTDNRALILADSALEASSFSDAENKLRRIEKS